MFVYLISQSTEAINKAEGSGIDISRRQTEYIKKFSIITFRKVTDNVLFSMMINQQGLLPKWGTSFFLLLPYPMMSSTVKKVLSQF